MTLVIKGKNHTYSSVISLYDLQAATKTVDCIRIFFKYIDATIFIEKESHIIYEVKYKGKGNESYLQEITFDKAFEKIVSIISNSTNCDGLHDCIN